MSSSRSPRSSSRTSSFFFSASSSSSTCSMTSSATNPLCRSAAMSFYLFGEEFGKLGVFR